MTRSSPILGVRLWLESNLRESCFEPQGGGSPSQRSLILLQFRLIKSHFLPFSCYIFISASDTISKFLLLIISSPAPLILRNIHSQKHPLPHKHNKQINNNNTCKNTHKQTDAPRHLRRKPNAIFFSREGKGWQGTFPNRKNTLVVYSSPVRTMRYAARRRLQAINNNYCTNKSSNSENKYHGTSSDLSQ